MSDGAERELDYYKRQVDTLAGENLKLDYVIAGLRHDVKQKRQGFALLSRLHESIGLHTTSSELFAAAAPAINATVAMDRTVVLTPVGEPTGRFRIIHAVGYQDDEAERIRGAEVDLPRDTIAGVAKVVVNRATPPSPLGTQITAVTGIPFFVGVPILVNGQAVAFLLSGRLLESKPLYPPLDDGDLDTFVAIAGLIAASIRNMRVGVLEKLDKMKSEFFANLSHEFRTPITLTIGPLEQLLKGRYGALGAAAEEQLRVMQRNQARLLSLVNQILDLAKLEAGRMELRPVATPHVNTLIAELAAQFSGAADQRGVKLELRLGSDVDGADLFVDREKLERVIWNLLSNALKFTREGSVTVWTSLEGRSFRFTVSDTGVGIRADQLPHIFDRFRQADGSEAREYAGSGIGLSLVREIAELHGGQVAVESEYDAGSSFAVILPLGSDHLDPASIVNESDSGVPDSGSRVRGELAFISEGTTDTSGLAEAREANEAMEGSFDAGKPSVLYAEDNPDLRHHVRRLLVGSYNIFLAVDGRDALERVRQYHPDLVLTDHMMPGMSGRDLLNAVRADPALRDTPVIFLTARAGTDARVESLDAGVDDYITKPFNEGELLARVRNVLRARSQERTLAQLNRRLEARVEEQLAALVRSGELHRFLPSALVETVLTGQLATDARTDDFERRKITVLSTDVTGLLELTEELEPEELSAAMNEFFREISAAAVEHGGTVDHLIANGVTILFGAPTTSAPADQALASVRTALAMRERLRNLVPLWRRRGVTGKLALRAGIQTGFCTVGVFGSDLLRSYTAVGSPVTVASALRDDASPGVIVSGPAAWALLQDVPGVRAKARGARTINGVARPMESYEIVALAEPDAPIEQPSQRWRDYSFMPR